MIRVLLLLAVCASTAFAQGATPVIAGARKQIGERAQHLVDAAKEMPADKYGFKATPGQMTFGHIVFHTAMSDYFLCSALAGEKPTKKEGFSDTDPKDKLVTALQQSAEYCGNEIAKLDPAKLGDEVTFPWAKMTKAEVLLELNADLADHYSLASTYLRLNGLLPPTAKK